MRSNIIIIAGLLLLAAIVMSSLSPVRLKADKTVVTHRGIVAEVYETALNDLVVKLKGRPEIYYLDKDVHHHLDFEEIKNQLVDRPVSIEFGERWDPLPEEQPQHYVSKLEIEDELVVSE